VASMETQEARIRQSAVALIAAERAVTRELDMVRKNKKSDRVLLERLLEEQGRAVSIKSWLKQTLQELREGIRQARSFRATIQRWECIAAMRHVRTSRRLLWKAYNRLCDLSDRQLNCLDEKSARSEGARIS
jgi:hypothetical protein